MALTTNWRLLLEHEIPVDVRTKENWAQIIFGCLLIHPKDHWTLKTGVILRTQTTLRHTGSNPFHWRVLWILRAALWFSGSRPSNFSWLGWHYSIPACCLGWPCASMWMAALSEGWHNGITHRIHVWYIYLYLPSKSTKCRQVNIPDIIPDMDGRGKGTSWKITCWKVEPPSRWIQADLQHRNSWYCLAHHFAALAGQDEKRKSSMTFKTESQGVFFEGLPIPKI